MRSSKKPIYGQVIQPCKVTRSGLLLTLVYIGGPIVLVLGLLDAVIWVIAKYGFGACYGFWCWF